MNAFKIGAFGGQGARARARCDDQRVIIDVSAMGQFHRLRLAINLGGVRRENNLDILVLVPGFRTEIEALLGELALHIGLGQRWALVGQGRFVRNERQLAFIATLAQRLKRLRASLSAADDDDACCACQIQNAFPSRGFDQIMTLASFLQSLMALEFQPERLVSRTLSDPTGNCA